MPPTIVFDIGSTSVRCGLQTNSGEAAKLAAEVPKLTIPTLVGHPREQLAAGSSEEEVFCGLDAVRMRSVCEMRHPVRDGHIHSPADFRMLISHVCSMFSSSSLSEMPAVVTEPLFAPKSFRQEVANLLFDMKVPSILFVSQGLSSLFAVGELSGIILDMGEDSTRAIAAVDGIGLPTTFATTRLGGSAVTTQMRGVLQDSGQMKAADYAAQIKEALCEAAVDTDAAAAAMMMVTTTSSKGGSSGSGGSTRDFTLPDSQIVKIHSAERFRCAEVLFANSSGSSVAGQPMSVTQVVEECVSNTDEILRPHLLSRLHCCGGTASLPGFEQRLLYELRRPREGNDFTTTTDPSAAATTTTLAMPDSTRCLFSIPVTSTFRGCRVHPSNRTWAGAAIFASLSSTEALFTSQRDYQEHGAGALGRFRQLAA